MTVATQNLRIEGVYPQRQKEFFMQRIKLPAGIISAEQARTVSEIADRFARGMVHLTTRGSIELHWLSEADLAPVAAALASVGLISRGACGGAVRGVVCGSLGTAGAPQLEALARRIHRHFSGNPRFEKLPKKFKIGIEADTASGRHLIQDIGLVPVPSDDGRHRYNVWAAGGLGREPTPGFLLAEGVVEERLLPLLEVVIRLYTAHTPAGKRLKHLVRELGADEFRRRVLTDPAAAEELPTAPSLSASLVPVPASPAQRLEVGIFAGELTSRQLAALAEFSQQWASGILLVTGNQNIVVHLNAAADPAAARLELARAGFPGTARKEQVTFRVCPGNHECIAGLAPTRDIAAAVLEQLGPVGTGLSWAISGCPNCCAQPQLADVGIVVAKLVSGEGERTPLFDLYRATGTGGFAEATQRSVSQTELLAAVRQLT
jgi:ferredoxin-nitrite reductase